MFCRFCGQELDDDSEFCPKCGRKQKETITDRFEETVHDFTKQIQPKIEEAGRSPKFSFRWALYTVLKRKYSDFSGRACRSEYWWYILFVNLLYIGMSIVGGVFTVLTGMIGAYLMLALFIIALVGLLVPSIAVTVRRMHDLNVSGWWLILFLVLSLIPLINNLLVIGYIICFCLKGTSGPNKFGEDPLAANNQLVSDARQ